MKIALLGASQSGKTVYFSALSYMFRHAVAFTPLSKAELAAYRAMGVDRRVGLSISVSSGALEKTLSKNAKLLAKKPIAAWPEPTKELDKAEVDVHFRFVDIEGEEEVTDNHVRQLELFDPTGGALSGDHEESDEIVEQLVTCDIAIAFLPADVIAECVQDEDIIALRNEILLGKITDILMLTRNKLKKNDILPVCFVISKADELQSRSQEFLNSLNEMLYDQIIIPFSKQHPNLMICVCPISVLNPETGNFRGSNLEWPFLFAAGGTIFRNSVELRAEAKDNRKEAKRLEEDAEVQRHSGWWNRFKKFIKGDGVNAKRRLAAAHRNEAGRLVAEAEDDHALAKNAWGSLAIEGKGRQVQVYMEGRAIDPRTVTGAM